MRKANKQLTVDNILQAIKTQAEKNERTFSGHLTNFGIRTVSEDVAVGETLSNSFVWDWENGCETEEHMDGVSTTFIGTFGRFSDDEEITESIEEAIEIHNRTGYIGKYQYLVVGDGYDYGDDEGEAVLYNHKAILKTED